MAWHVNCMLYHIISRDITLYNIMLPFMYIYIYIYTSAIVHIHTDVCVCIYIYIYMHTYHIILYYMYLQEINK